MSSEYFRTPSLGRAGVSWCRGGTEIAAAAGSLVLRPRARSCKHGRIFRLKIWCILIFGAQFVFIIICVKIEHLQFQYK